MNIWNEMYSRAKQVQNSRTISVFIDAGGVAAAILTANNNIYVGVCIDTSSSLGMCAERNTIANSEVHGNAYRHPQKYRILVSENIEEKSHSSEVITENSKRIV